MQNTDRQMPNITETMEQSPSEEAKSVSVTQNFVVSFKIWKLIFTFTTDHTRVYPEPN